MKRTCGDPLANDWKWLECRIDTDLAGLEVSGNFSARAGADRPPCVEVDVFADETGAAVAHQRVNAADMVAAGCEDAIPTRSHIGDVAVRVVVMVVSRPILTPM